MVAVSCSSFPSLSISSFSMTSLYTCNAIKISSNLKKLIASEPLLCKNTCKRYSPFVKSSSIYFNQFTEKSSNGLLFHPFKWNSKKKIMDFFCFTKHDIGIYSPLSFAPNNNNLNFIDSISKRTYDQKFYLTYALTWLLSPKSNLHFHHLKKSNTKSRTLCRCESSYPAKLVRPNLSSPSDGIIDSFGMSGNGNDRFGGGGGWNGGGGRGRGGRGGEGDKDMQPLKASSRNVDNSLEEANSHGVIILDVGGMSCGGCASAVKNILEGQPDVLSASVNLPNETAIVKTKISEEREINEMGKLLAKELTERGFTSTYRETSNSENKREGNSQHESSFEIIKRKRAEKIKKLKESGRRVMIAWTLAAVCIAGHVSHFLHASTPKFLHFLHSTPLHALLSITALLGPGRKLLVDGWNSFRKGNPNMNTLVGLGAVSSFSFSAVAALFPKLGWPCFFEEPVMLLAFVLLGRAVEERAKLQASSDMSSLLNLMPSHARLVVEKKADSAGESEIPNLDKNANNFTELDKFETVLVPVASLSIGDKVVVLPGDRIPVDGIVLTGKSSVDESSLTGENLPVLKKRGDEVTAGSMNYNGSIEIEILKTAEKTKIAEILKMVENAQLREAPVQKLVDKVSGKFCYGVMGLSSATFLFWNFLGPQLFPSVIQNFAGSPALLAIQLACNVLVIACPCALGLATPTAVLVGTSLGAKNGIFIRGGDILENMKSVSSIVFDKTGTLTLGRPKVTRVFSSNADTSSSLTRHHSTPNSFDMENECFSEDDVLLLAGAVESFSSHPLARAVAEEAKKRKSKKIISVDKDSFREEPGSGACARINGRQVAVGNIAWVKSQLSESIQSQVSNEREGLHSSNAEKDEMDGNTVVHVSMDGTVIGFISLMDEIREESYDVIQNLKKLNFEIFMLSGDKKNSANKIASMVGIQNSNVFAEVKPQDKARFVEDLQVRSGKQIAMIGDGINDSIALAKSDVGISMISGLEIARESSDVILMRDDLRQVSEVIELSRATFKKIEQNLLWAFVYNIVGLPIAAGALLPWSGPMLSPSIAGALMGFSSIGVMLNSLALRLEFKAKFTHSLQAKPQVGSGQTEQEKKRLARTSLDFESGKA